MPNTGYKGYSTLEEYWTDNGTATGVTKANTEGQADYIAPVYDLSSCPTDTTPPSTPSNVSYDSGTTTITMYWSASTDNSGIAYYEVSLNSVLYGTTTSLTLTMTGLQPATGYNVMITAVDNYGNRSMSIGGSILTAPVSLTISLDPSYADIDYNAQPVIFNITSNYPSYVYSRPSWIGINAGSGGSREIRLNVEVNNTGMERYGNVDIIYNSQIIATFSIIQQ